MRKTFIYTMLFLVFILSVFMSIVAIKWQYFIQNPLDIPAHGLVITLEPGTSVRQFSNELGEQGVLNKPNYFVWLTQLKEQTTALQAGEYLIPSNSTPEKLLNQLVAGDVLKYPVRIGEGWTFEMILASLAENSILDHQLEDTNKDDIMTALGYEAQNPEGLFYPDTYYITRGSSDIQLLQQAYAKMQALLADEWENRTEDLPYVSAYDALIMASIIEREAGARDNRADIAGVLVKRLELGMLLQVDPSVIYGLGQAYEGALTRADLRNDTPYNTYIHAGLPITPIAMPSQASIHAALHPNISDNLFFVSKGDGTHQFSATLEEHQAAIDTYILGQ